RGAEAEQAEALGVPAHPQRPVADQAGTEQRRRLPRIRVRVERERVAGVGPHQLGIAAVARVAVELGPLAEVLASRQALAALAASPAQPGHTDPCAGLE